MRAPSKRSDAVRDEITCASRRLRFVYVGRSMSKFRRQISGRAFNFLVSAFPETSPVRQIFYLLRMVMHASPSDTLAKFSPLRQTVEGFVVDLVRDVSVPVFVQNLYLLLVSFEGPVLGCLENCNRLKAHVSSILCGTERCTLFSTAPNSQNSNKVRQTLFAFGWHNCMLCLTECIKKYQRFIVFLEDSAF